MCRESKDIEFEKLIPFKGDQKYMHEEDWMQQLADCIKRAGLMDSVIVRPVDNGKYEVLCGHNRIKALEMLGCTVIHADIRNGLSDEDATKIYSNSNLRQQPFSACSYAQRFETVKYYKKIMEMNSRQGKRTDLEEKAAAKSEKTCVQPVSNSEVKEDTCAQLVSNFTRSSRRPTNRDEAAHSLGISTSTLSKYIRIIKLPDNLLQSIANLLDEKRITFEAAYVISGMRNAEIKILIGGINNHTNKKLNLDKLKKLLKKNTEKSDDTLHPFSKKAILDVFTN
ncbi:MAG: ParB N-terminal domain-containing protein [Lachnospiraceae bacterium]|nr:ParB N-terminal domain-containing protein [Lachnospiraceae bacterium]